MHADAKAAQSARTVNALAYTVGQHIVFATDCYAPNTASGMSLLAHELAHVIQQRSGGVVVQRQPDDRKTGSRDLEKMNDEFEHFKWQVGEGAEDLEILRWQLALQHQALPRADSRVDQNTATFVEAAIESSQVLRPFLRGKLAKTSVAANFKIYDFRVQFESEDRKRSKNGSGAPSAGRSSSTNRTYGFYHRRTDSIHLPPDAKFSSALHEGIHKYSSVTIQSALGIFINEGFTQFFTDEVLREHSLGSSSHTYKENLDCAKIVLGWINNDRNTLGRAYFQGDAKLLVEVVRRKLRLNTARDLIQLVEDRDGLGLCERITEATS